jgi:hypothetical protein
MGDLVYRLNRLRATSGVRSSTHAHMPTAPARPVDLRMPSSELCTATVQVAIEYKTVPYCLAELKRILWSACSADLTLCDVAQGEGTFGLVGTCRRAARTCTARATAGRICVASAPPLLSALLSLAARAGPSASLLDRARPIASALSASSRSISHASAKAAASLWAARAPHPPGGTLAGGSPDESHSTAS